MRSLAKHFAEATQTSAAPQEPATGFQIVACQPTMEGFTEQLTQALGGREVQLIQFPTATASQESQQIDKDAVDDLTQQYQDLIDLLNPKEPVDNVQVFLLDDAGMVSGTAGSAAAIKALVQASMNGGRKVVAAMSRSWKPGPCLPAMESLEVRAAAKTLRDYLSANNIPSCESFDELRDTLAAL